MPYFGSEKTSSLIEMTYNLFYFKTIMKTVVEGNQPSEGTIYCGPYITPPPSHVGSFPSSATY